MKMVAIPALLPHQKERLLGKIKKTDSCWLWAGSVDGCGYGMVAFHNSGKRYSCRVHRVMWSEVNGGIPDQMRVLHKCDNPPCCNPDHLFLGSQKDNVDDMWKKNRANPQYGDRNGSRLHPESRPRGDAHYSRIKPERLARGSRNGSVTKPEKRPKGTGHWKCFLDEATVLEIRAIRKTGLTYKAIADRFNLSKSHVACIITRRLWKHLPDPSFLERRVGTNQSIKENQSTHEPGLENI